MRSSDFSMWTSAVVMVTIISSCSLVGISIVPLISGKSYKIFNSLFTGLAVGSLLGSAIFSLIPQAFGLHQQVDKSYLWKSLIIFLGLYLFYCSERLLVIYFERKTRQHNQNEQTRLRSGISNKDDGSSSLSASNSRAKQPGDNRDLVAHNTRSSSRHQAGDSHSHKAPKCQEDGSLTMTEISLAKDTNEETETHDNHGHHHHHPSALESHHILSRALSTKDHDETAVPRKARINGIAPMAWMIIIGDGLHNFIDGLSIGAAFTESLQLGFNTSLAVIFEEFPHELGDFAVLIASGMTVRQALIFNFLSACTCYIGMVVGILLGDLTSSASYIFALAGGMFLYISLVDMMGELTAMLEEARHSAKEATRVLITQNIGILSGIIILFMLSLHFNA